MEITFFLFLNLAKTISVKTKWKFYVGIWLHDEDCFEKGGGKGTGKRKEGLPERGRQQGEDCICTVTIVPI
jgi:hypothetical protein